jgi:hypothetical protein
VTIVISVEYIPIFDLVRSAMCIECRTDTVGDFALIYILFNAAMLVCLIEYLILVLKMMRWASCQIRESMGNCKNIVHLYKQSMSLFVDML